MIVMQLRQMADALEAIAKAAEATELLLPNQQSVDELRVCVRVRRILKMNGIRTVFDLLQRTEADLCVLRGFAETALDEVNGALAKLGLRLKE